jgi:lipopolysaccharide biosynthesis protein
LATVSLASLRPSVAVRVLRAPGELHNRRVCVFVSYSPTPAIRPHVRFHIEALLAEHFTVVLMLNVDDAPRPLKFDAVAGLVIRANAGFDFGAWADAFRMFPALWSAESVLLVNDSVFGPFGDFHAVIERAYAGPADVVGMTENHQYTHHIQSYFTLLRGAALRSEGVRRTWQSTMNLPTKEDVIRRYELEMRARYTAMGLTCATLFKAERLHPQDPLYHKWTELADGGMPYIKVAQLMALQYPLRLAGWRERIGDERLLAIIDGELFRRWKHILK